MRFMDKPKTEEASPQVFSRLRRYNAIMGFFHLAQGIFMLAITNNFTLPVTTSYLSYDISTQAIETVTETIFNIQIGPMVAVFLFISAAAHFLLATVLYGWYVRNLKKHMNMARWYEYALSSSLMIVVIAMLVGVYDLSSLILLFGINAAMIFFGLLMEVHNQTTAKTNWTAFIFGCVAGIIPWIVIFLYFSSAIASTGEAIPKFVYAILASIFIFFNIFAINMVLQYKKAGRWKSYLYGESAYILLSLVAKSALAWQIFSGTLRG